VPVPAACLSGSARAEIRRSALNTLFATVAWHFQDLPPVSQSLVDGGAHATGFKNESD